MTIRPNRFIAAIVAASAAALLAGCGGAETSPAATDEQGRTSLTWGYALTDAAPILLGIEKGVFEEHGIDLTAKEVGPADLVGGLLSGDIDLSVNTGPGLALAASKNVPTVAVAGITTFEKGAHGTTGSALLTRKDDDISSPKDLVGKKVGVNQLASASEYGVRQLVQDDGGDAAEVSIVEVPFASAGDSLAKGDVDAVLVADPFLSQLMAAGAVDDPLGDPIEIVFGASPRLIMTATRDFAAKNPEVVDDLQAAVAESIELAEESPEELQAIYREHFKMSSELAKATYLNHLEATIDASDFDRINDVMVTFGALAEPLSTDDLVAK